MTTTRPLHRVPPPPVGLTDDDRKLLNAVDAALARKSLGNIPQAVSGRRPTHAVEDRCSLRDGLWAVAGAVAAVVFAALVLA